MVPSKPKKSAPKSAPGKPAARRRLTPVVEAQPTDRSTDRKLTWRTGIFLLVIVIVLVMFLPLVNPMLKQAQQIAALNSEIDTTKSEVETLRQENEDLRDPKQIARMAREDQYYVEKGKNVVIVTNQETASGQDSDSDRPSRPQAWYLELLESIQEVGNTAEKGR